MDNFRAWWEGLAQREQQLVGACGAFVLLGFLYWGIWTPIANAEADAEAAVRAQKQTLEFVKQTANQIAGLRQNGGKSSARGSITNVVNQTAGKFSLTITRMQPQGDKLQLWMDDVPFDALLGFLNELVQQKGLALDSLDLAQTDTPGLVKVRRIQLAQ